VQDKNTKQRVEAVPGLNALITKAKKIVTFSKRSVKTSDELRRIQQEEMNLSQGATLKLTQDVSTRWNSTYFMLKRLLAMSDIISAALLRNPEAPEMLTGREMQTCTALLQVLKPLYEMTAELSAQSTCTASKVIPLVNLAKKVNEMIVFFAAPPQWTLPTRS